jgi:hypothetical protein
VQSDEPHYLRGLNPCQLAECAEAGILFNGAGKTPMY